jgi:Inosine-uridine preferring nucleoside hydrolase
LIDKYPGAAAKIDTLVVMGGNFCVGYEPYPDVMAPTDETNIACDPASANFVLDGAKNPITNIYYVPVEMADAIGGDDYLKNVAAANPGAAATLDFYRAWSKAGRADAALLIHLEALAYDPETESSPQFDPCAIMLTLELLDDHRCQDHVMLYNFDAVRFWRRVKANPFQIRRDLPFRSVLKVQRLLLCRTNTQLLSEYTFDPADTHEYEMAIRIALGYTSPAAKAQYHASMASRVAGEIPDCKHRI